MISHSEVVELSNKFGILPDAIEKDYCITWLLMMMAEEESLNDVVFYGGSALKKVYFPDYRFSEDIDFLTEKKIDFKNFIDTFKSLYKKVDDRANLPLSTDEDSIDINEDRLQFFVRYEGIEYSKGGAIKVDILRDAAFIENPIRRAIILPYRDMANLKTKLLVYSIEAILAGKIGALTGRSDPRDLYDVWFLLTQNDVDMVKAKKCLEKKYGYEFKKSNILPHIDKETHKRLWEPRLAHQVQSLPDIDAVRTVLVKKIKYIFDSDR